jgi:hypothetical protein
VFGAKPIFIDEVVQMYQARLMAAGRLLDPVGPYPEFFGALNVVSTKDGQFGQFPPGGPLHFAIGVMIGAPWLIGPVFGGASVYVFSRFVRLIQRESGIVLGATLLLAASPFMMFMSASHMNHVPTLFWILLSWLAAAHVAVSERGRAAWAGIFGLSAGVAAAIRPVDALVLCGSAAVWCAWTVRRRPDRLLALLTFVLGCIAPLSGLLWYNAATTGSPFQFGYDLMWGKTHSLGFHGSPWGDSHTPARGLELLNLYVLRLQSYVFESPAPALLGVIAVLALARALVGWLLAALTLLMLAYFAYWHDGFYLGPRFLFAALPILVLLTAQAPSVLGEITRRDAVRRFALLSLVVAVAIGLVYGTPERARYYARSLSTSRHELTLAADTLGIRDAVIFVRESWGAQVLARMWGRNVDRPAAELFYRSIDTCVLDSALAALESANLRGPAATERLRPLLVDSMRVQPSTLSPDRSERVRLGGMYSAHCLSQVENDRRGVTLYPLVLAHERGSNIYARDLGARNTLLLQLHPERTPYLLLPKTLDGAAYELQPINLGASALPR